ncbi:MAG: hypothetical protein LJE95_11955 [Acidobacteria bacterium]|nr:hypothetical protein [Acidobacteriota bacterium]
MKTLKLLVGAGLALVLAACVLKTTRHTVYLEPDGSVVWTVLEEDVHSDARTAVDRRKEECDWLAAVHAGEHGVARGLALLGGDPVSRVLRSERPFVVWTEARFDSFEELATRLVSDLQLPARLDVDSGAGGGGFTLELDLAAAEGMDGGDNPLIELLDGIENARLVLPEGEFVSAEGFELDENRRTARPLAPPDEVLEAKAGTIRWSLHWTTARNAANPPPLG